MNWKAAKEAIDAVGADGMSGEETETDDEGPDPNRVSPGVT